MTRWKGLAITWLGHSTAHITTPAGTEILIDPFIEHNPKFPRGYALPEKLDLLLLTHGHSDHIADAVSVAKKHSPHVVAMYELAHWIGTKGVEHTIPMNTGGSWKYKDVTITMTEAHHSSGIDDGGHMIYGGDPAGFVIAAEGASVLYHAGDTSLFSDMRLIKDLYRPEVGMVPIGDHFTMGPKTAALAATYLGLKTIIPIHYGTFPQLTGTPAELEEHLKDAGIEVVTPKPGEALR